MSALIILLLIVLNGVFAMAEIAVVSANKLRLRQKAEAGVPAAKRALTLAEHPNTFLSTTQIGITLVGVFSGAFGGATLSGPLARVLERVPFLEGIADPLAFGFVVVLITYVSLVVGELVPKRIGLNDPERVAMAIGGLMLALSVIGKPLVSFLGASTNALLALMGVKQGEADDISEADIDMVIAQGLRAGVIEPAEQEIIENAFWLGERKVNAIMTPRHDVSWFDVSATPEEVLEQIRTEPHGRYLVCEGELDRVVGFVVIRDLLAAKLDIGSFDLRAALHKPLLVPETLPILSLLNKFRDSRTHIAVVLDEYGGVEGRGRPPRGGAPGRGRLARAGFHACRRLRGPAGVGGGRGARGRGLPDAGRVDGGPVGTRAPGRRRDVVAGLPTGDRGDGGAARRLGGRQARGGGGTRVGMTCAVALLEVT